MARTSTRLMRLIALLLFLSITAVYAQADLPDLATVTNTNEATSAASTGEPTTAASTAESSAETTGDAATTDSTANGGTAAQTTATFPDATSSGTTFRLTGLPTIAGAGVPTIVVPYTANAPFMQKSSVPEGTVFIAVGAVLAFLGACVLLWRGLVAWSVNRSVRRAALASIRGTEKPGAWGGGHHNSKSAYYKEFEGGSSMSLDHLTSSGKVQKPGKNEEGIRQSSAAPPAGLFFSPTAQASNRASTYSVDIRGSTYLPAGYYALPSADAPAGGRNSAVMGSSHPAPYARNSYMGGQSPSPPGSPNPTTPGSRPASNFYGGPGDSRAGLRSGSRDGPRSASRGPPSRDGYGGRGSHLYTQPSSSSLAVGQSTSDLPGQRAPSAIFDDMLDVHGNGPRERF